MSLLIRLSRARIFVRSRSRACFARRGGLGVHPCGRGYPKCGLVTWLSLMRLVYPLIGGLQAFLTPRLLRVVLL